MYLYFVVGKIHTAMYEVPLLAGRIEVVSERFAEIKHLEKVSMPKGSTWKRSKVENVHECPLSDVI